MPAVIFSSYFCVGDTIPTITFYEVISIRVEAIYEWVRIERQEN